MAVVAVCVVRQRLSSPQITRRAVNILYVPALRINGSLGLEVCPTGRRTVIDYCRELFFLYLAYLTYLTYLTTLEVALF